MTVSGTEVPSCAGLSLRGHADVAGFVAAFTGSHRRVLDYLAEEVLERQLDEVRGWWRCHRLFAGLLRARLQQNSLAGRRSCTAMPRPGARSMRWPMTPSGMRPPPVRSSGGPADRAEL